ncbi:hypothetical protein [Streptomyces sp. cmx-18-6]|uniref:hypothetical protein n=1 Tax=Streptomyces sp. cmx-18-6 TaxID=2790930 RepID=UPI0039805D5B
MLKETTGRTAQDLAAELEGLRGVDWASVWAGPPQGGSPEFDAWCGRYGWEPKTVEGNLIVRTRSGGKMTLWSGGIWNPVRGLTHYAWEVMADAPAENPDVLSAGNTAWPEILQAAVSVLGAPVWSGAWDAEDFPEPPESRFWRGKESRLQTRNPYRLAFWEPVGEHPGQVFFTLEQSVAFPTWTVDTPGGSTIALDVYAPEGSRRRW